MLRGWVPVSSFPFFYDCITNNIDLAKCVSNAQFIDGPALSVLIMARNLIHKGWKLAASPFYGNLKPNQQPYRTLVLSSGGENEIVKVEEHSLFLIESAIVAYSECKVIRKPCDMAEEIDMDYKYVDFALMEETLKSCGMLRECLKRTAGR